MPNQQPKQLSEKSPKLWPKQSKQQSVSNLRFGIFSFAKVDKDNGDNGNKNKKNICYL